MKHPSSARGGTHLYTTRTIFLEFLVFSSTSAVFILLRRKYTKVQCNKNEVEEDVSNRNDSICFQEEKKEDDIINTSGEKRELSLREMYKPWAMTPSAFSENKKGWVYVRGYIAGGQQAILWYRPSLHKISYSTHQAYFRALLNGVQTCITESKRLSGGKNEKCNVILDATSFGFSFIPSMDVTKEILVLFDSLFPGHLGQLVIANMSGAAQLFFKMVIPFLPTEVQRKIHILPSYGKKRTDMVKSLIQDEYVPTWLGGNDPYVFDAEMYYKSGKYKSHFISDDDGLKFKKLLQAS